MKMVSVSEIMTKDVVVISPDISADVALELMGSRSIRRLPVVSDTDRLIGIVTREDARLAVERARCEDPISPRMPKVREVMTDYVYSVEPTDSLAEAAKIMVLQRVGAVPVLKDRKVVGLITESDIFKFIAAHSSATAEK